VAEKKQQVKDLSPGQNIRDLFVLAEARLGQAKNGPYWSLGLTDASGRVEGRLWSPAAQSYPEITPGQVVRVTGQTQSFRDQTQIMVESLEFLAQDVDEADLRRLIPVSGVSPPRMLRELEEILASGVAHKPWVRFCKSVLGDRDIRERLVWAPGAKAIHHAYAGGLLEHTLAVTRLCAFFTDLYPALDREVLLVAAAFHDLGKAWELTCGVVRDYTDQGRLLGHIQIGLEVLEPHVNKVKDLDPDLVTHFKHLLISHHGEYGFGSPKRPKTAEAFALHFADNLDAKINTSAEAFAADPEASGAWSPWVRSLERALYKPRRTPGDADDQNIKDGLAQCLLPLKE
jgi:3'-5' exoribonuclease